MTPRLHQLATELRAERKRVRKAKAAELGTCSKHVRPIASGQRTPRVREPLYLAWIRRLPCVACLKLGVVQTSRVEAAHIRCGFAADGWRATGMQEKPSDLRVGPLCRWHHREGPDAQHGMNERKFWERLGIHPPEMCALLRQAFLGGADAGPLLQDFVSSELSKTVTKSASAA